MENLKAISDDLSKLTVQEFLLFFKSLKQNLKNEPFRNGRMGSFNKMLLAAGSNYASFEKNFTILNLQKESYREIKAGKSRADIKALTRKYKESMKPGEEELEHISRLAQAAIIEIIIKVFAHFKYGLDEQRLPFQGSGADKEDLLQFNYYYWHESSDRSTRRVATGILKLVCLNAEKAHFQPQSAELILSHTKKADKMPVVLIAEKIIATDGVMHFLFADSANLKLKSHMTLYIGKTLPARWIYLNGVYATVSRSNHDTPIAGAILVEQISEQHPDQSLNDVDQVSPQIHNFLHRTRITSRNSVFLNENQLPTNTEISKLKQYVGFYAGTYFKKSKRRGTNLDDRVEQFYFEIFPSGEAVMNVPNVGEPYRGRVRVLNNNAMLGYFDFLSQENTYRFTIYFSNEFKDPGKKKERFLYAVYAGMEKSASEIPTGGRMIFRRIEDKLSHEAKMAYVLSFSVEEFLAENDRVKDIDVLSGAVDEPDDFIETLPNPKKFLYQNKKQNLKFAGTYFVYCLSTTQNGIYKTPLRIDKNGLVHFKTREAGSGIIHQGFAVYNNINRLSIYLENALRPESYFHLLFSLGNAVASESHHYFGVSSKFDSFGHPTGKMEILVKEEFDFDTTESTTFKIGEAAYIDEDRKSGILSYLTGKDNRFIVARTDPNTDFKRGNNRVHFYAACYLAAKAESQSERTEAIGHLYQAYLHGFGKNSGDMTLLDAELKSSFVKFSGYGAEVKPDNSQLKPLTFDEIIARLKAFEEDPYLKK